MAINGIRSFQASLGAAKDVVIENWKTGKQISSCLGVASFPMFISLAAIDSLRDEFSFYSWGVAKRTPTAFEFAVGAVTCIPSFAVALVPAVVIGTGAKVVKLFERKPSAG